MAGAVSETEGSRRRGGRRGGAGRGELRSRSRGREFGFHSKWEPLRGFKQQNEGIPGGCVENGAQEGGRGERHGGDPGESDSVL